MHRRRWRFYATTSGAKPVQSFLDNSTAAEAAEVVAAMKEVAREGLRFARHLRCDIKVMNRIVNGRRAGTAEMALELGAALGTSPEFWPSAQEAVDLYEASKRIAKLSKRSPHLATA
ncbi:MAG: HigA family addiction module antitoxin [Myxococcales bacterium]|nr:HigA family addiction module antitoxin [Myxococcales bacterium]